MTAVSVQEEMEASDVLPDRFRGVSNGQVGQGEKEESVTVRLSSWKNQSIGNRNK